MTPSRISAAKGSESQRSMGVDGLDVVMVVAAVHPRALALELGVYDGVAVRGDERGLDAVGAHLLLHKLYHLGYSLAGPGQAGLAAELAQELYILLAVGLDVVQRFLKPLGQFSFLL